MKNSSCSSLLVLLLVAFTDLAAQEAPTLRDSPGRRRPVLYSGERVRVTAPDFSDEPMIGTVVSLEAGILTMQPDGSPSPLVIPSESMSSIEVARMSSGAVGGVLGGVVGIAAGAFLAGAIVSGSGSAGASLAVVAGAGVGAIAGYYGGKSLEKAIVGWKWEPMPVSRLRMSLLPTPRHGLAFSIDYSF